MTKKPRMIEVRLKMERVPEYYGSIPEFQKHFNEFFTKVPNAYWMDTTVALEPNQDTSEYTLEVSYQRPETAAEKTLRLAAARKHLRTQKEKAEQRIKQLQEEIEKLSKFVK